MHDVLQPAMSRIFQIVLVVGLCGLALYALRLWIENYLHKRKTTQRQMSKRGKPQIAVISEKDVTWIPKQILNRSETIVYLRACAVAASLEPSWRIWPQVALGEVLKTEGFGHEEAHRWINSKRADLLIADAENWPLAVIEYQGTGHYEGNANERDAVKRIALSRAGVLYIEVPRMLSRREDELDNFLRRQLDPLRPGGLAKMKAKVGNSEERKDTY
jgi:hypothetical protein